MAQKKLNSDLLSKLVNEHVDADRQLTSLQEDVQAIDAFMERYEAGEEISEEELNEFLGGLGAVGKWGRKKAGDAIGKAGQAIKGAASDMQQAYQKGQRASNINKQRKAVDKQQVANTERVQQLAAQGKQVSDAIKKYRLALANIGAEYQKLTGKEYVPGRAVANAKRYIDESQKKK